MTEYRHFIESGEEIWRRKVNDGKNEIVNEYDMPNQSIRREVVGNYGRSALKDFGRVESYEDDIENNEVLNMGESNSRYSIVENLTREKNASMDQVKRLEQTKLQIAKDSEDLKDRQADELRKTTRQNELAIKQMDLEIQFQKDKAAELDKAIEQVAKISKEVTRTE